MTAAGPEARFSEAELAYLLGERRLGRLATADASGQPHVVPVGWSYNRELGTTYWQAPNCTTPLTFRKRFANLPATSATFMFSDAALIVTWTNPPTAQESYSLAAPQATKAGGPTPTTHFRHSGLANVAFADGHVELREEVPVASPASWSPAANDLRQKLRLGYLADTNMPYVGQ